MRKEWNINLELSGAATWRPLERLVILRSLGLGV